MQRLQRAVLPPFIVLATIGLLLSIVSHGCAMFGLAQPLARHTWNLHIGSFVVFFPAVLVLQSLTREFKNIDFWRAALRGCPLWMRRALYGFVVYAILNFTTFFVLVALAPPPQNAAIMLRGFSGHWMAFYAASISIMYSALVVQRSGPARRCPLGHTIALHDTTCETCGRQTVAAHAITEQTDA